MKFRESKCPFSSPIVLVRKADQTLRFCVDFRRLNAHTIKDVHALPRVDETLDSLIVAHKDKQHSVLVPSDFINSTDYHLGWSMLQPAFR